MPISEGEPVSAVDWWASGQCRNVHNDLIADRLASGASRANTERNSYVSISVFEAFLSVDARKQVFFRCENTELDKNTVLSD